MNSNTFADWGTAIKNSFMNAFNLLVGALPNIIGFVVVLLVGWWISGWIGNLIRALLRKVGLNNTAERAGYSSTVRAIGIRSDAAKLTGDVVKWFLRVVVLMAAFDILKMPVLSQLLQQFLLWLPNLIIALAILAIGGLGARLLGNLVRTAVARSGFGSPTILALLTRIAIMTLAVVVAVNQVGIGETLVNTLFIGVVAAAALAFGLAFGLGGRETASQIIQNWYARGREAMPRVRAAARAMSRDRMATSGSSAPDREGRPERSDGGRLPIEHRP